MSFRQLRRAIVGANPSLLAIEESRISPLLAVGIDLAKGERVSDERVAVACGSDEAADRLRQQAEFLSRPQIVQGPRGGKTAIVSFRGIVTYDIEYQPLAVSLKVFARTMRDLTADTDVKTILTFFDSPGGNVVGLADAADAMFEARQAKKVIAIVDPLAASAAYYVASQATEISLVPSGYGVGSIGVRMLHIECAEAMKAAGIKPTFIYSAPYKVEGNALEPLGEETKAFWQEESDKLYNEFLKAVARGRGLSVADVRQKFGQGRLLWPADAKKVGMVDRLEVADDTFRRFGLATSSLDARRAEAIADVPPDAEPTSAESETAPETDQQAAETAPLELNPEAFLADSIKAAAAADLDRRRRELDLY